MKTITETGTVRTAEEEEGKFEISFLEHAAYYHTLLEDVKEKILAAQKEKKKISFTFDRDLNILAVEEI